MGKHLKASSVMLILLLAFSVITLFLGILEVKADTLTFTSESTDGYISHWDSSYSIGHDTTTGQVVADTGYTFTVGQYYSSEYYFRRGFLFFDTSSIPNIATINSAVLSLYVSIDGSTTTEFNVTIQNGQPIYPHNPVAVGDYYYQRYSGDGGSSNTSTIGGVGYWNITLSEDGLDWINLIGITKLCLRSSNDINSVAPTGEEFVTFRAYEYEVEFSVSCAPRLYVEYEVAEEDYYNYLFYGPYDEETGYALPTQNVTVNVYGTEGAPFASFEMNQTASYNTTSIIRFLEFVFEDGSAREYWVDPSESSTATIYIFWGNTTNYILNFVDTTGILNTYPFVTIQRYVNGSLFTIEKLRTDVYKNVIANLVNGRTYQILLGNEETSYVFGDLTMTSVTALQLIIRGVEFPKETLITQKYVRIYGYRNFTAGSIVICFNDTQESTVSVFIEINLGDFTQVYNTTLYVNSFVFEWNSADNGTAYQVTATISHLDYGTLTWKQYYTQTFSTPPFSLAFLGDWGFDSEFLLPAFLILCVAGCFSALNAYVGAILMSFTAAVLAWWGWIPIPVGLLVAASVFSVLMALEFKKRGGGGIGY